jgi:protein-disulfide isomerase
MIDLNRRAVVLGGASVAGALALPSFAFAQGGDVLTEALVLRDPAIPAAGNPNGDVTIVEFSDYQCPYCRQVHPVLRKIAQEDGNIRLVFKIWPVFGAESVYAGQMALAAREQKKFSDAHGALMGIKTRLSETLTESTLREAGIDVPRARQHLEKDIKKIGAVLTRNHQQATGLGFQGTPSFIIGKFRVPGVLQEDMFKAAVADARKMLKEQKKKK